MEGLGFSALSLGERRLTGKAVGCLGPVPLLREQAVAALAELQAQAGCVGHAETLCDVAQAAGVLLAIVGVGRVAEDAAERCLGEGRGVYIGGRVVLAVVVVVV